jgi:hypothetical protein
VEHKHISGENLFAKSRNCTASSGLETLCDGVNSFGFKISYYVLESDRRRSFARLMAYANVDVGPARGLGSIAILFGHPNERRVIGSHDLLKMDSLPVKMRKS